ncbi:MAG: hypothetical protein KC620_09605, partial [Myxococcales bacterium]|nr:hypothetical protein [Myxococcales bacterium]
VWGTVAAVRQGVAGYPLLTPDALLRSAEPPPAGFYTAKGRPLLEALYRIGGEDGDRFLVPLDAYEGRLLVITRETPPATPVVVTGRLRTDVRTVQTSAEGQVEGPFVRLYREHMQLPPSTALYFLDTGVRAGLNARALALALVPFWLLLLVWGAPVRRRRRPPMRPLPARLSGTAADQRRGAR